MKFGGKKGREKGNLGGKRGWQGMEARFGVGAVAACVTQAATCVSHACPGPACVSQAVTCMWPRSPCPTHVHTCSNPTHALTPRSSPHCSTAANPAVLRCNASLPNPTDGPKTSCPPQTPSLTPPSPRRPSFGAELMGRRLTVGGGRGGWGGGAARPHPAAEGRVLIFPLFTPNLQFSSAVTPPKSKTEVRPRGDPHRTDRSCRSPSPHRSLWGRGGSYTTVGSGQGKGETGARKHDFGETDQPKKHRNPLRFGAVCSALGWERCGSVFGAECRCEAGRSSMGGKFWG